VEASIHKVHPTHVHKYDKNISYSYTYSSRKG
jgi:hypothetical protein